MYLSDLVSKGFLEIHKSPIMYVTPKGLKFIEKMKELTELSN